MKPVTLATILGSTLFAVSVFAQTAGSPPAESPGDKNVQTMPCGNTAPGAGCPGYPAKGAYPHHHHSGGGHHAGQHPHAYHQGDHYHADGKTGPWMMRMDTDRDGQISLEELKAAQQRQMERFEQADTNKDGKVSQDEMRAMRQSMREQYRMQHPGAGASGQAVPPCLNQPRG